jgi:gamma-glutamylcyclotransferase (GGCT)/AIG2-like uncharacterized protein YtfP
MHAKNICTLYFAYGSNLDPDQMKYRCPQATPLGTATLPRHRIAFAGYSHAREGAVATVLPESEATTPGLLYRLTLTDLELLDRFEGHPGFYLRSKRTVRDHRGRFQSAWVYQLPSEYPEGPPANEYFRMIQQAYRKMNWSTDSLIEARQRGMEGMPEAFDHLVFVYGTLRRGEPNHGLLEGSQCLGRTHTESRFTLLDLKYFPGLIRGGRTSVAGELYAVDEWTLRKLDSLEGHPSFYRREPILLVDGREVLSYIYQRDNHRRDRPIPSGDWVKHRKHLRKA